MKLRFNTNSENNGKNIIDIVDDSNKIIGEKIIGEIELTTEFIQELTILLHYHWGSVHI